MIDPRDADLNSRIKNLIIETGLPLKIFAENSGLTAAECLEWWSSKSTLPLSFDLERFCDFLGVSKYDLKYSHEKVPIIAKNVSSKRFQLPDRYSNTPLSYVATSRHIIEVMRTQFGSLKLYETLSLLGVSSAYFQNIENRINLHFFEDILDAYFQLAGKNADLNLLSRSLFLTVEETALSKIFSKAKNYRQAFEHIEASIPYFDLNFEYKFSVSESKATIEAKPSKELSAFIKSKRIGTDRLYQYRANLFGNMVTLSGMKPLKMDLVSCISQGDTSCTYSTNYN